MSRFVLSVSAGHGPEEVTRFVALLAQRFESYARTIGVFAWREQRVARRGGVRRATLHLCGQGAAAFEREVGTHLLIAELRGRAKRKRWFAGVALHEGRVLAGFRLEDVHFETCRSGGPGGQHVNRTSSAVRAVHVPSGLSVRVEDSRSQHRNRLQATEALRRRVEAAGAAEEVAAARIAEAEAFALERGNPVRTYRLSPKGALRCERT